MTDSRNSSGAATLKLHGGLLVAARTAWLAVSGLTLGLATAGFVKVFDRPELLRAPEVEALVVQLGISIRGVVAVTLLAPMLAVSIIAIFLFWRRSDDWSVMLFSLALLLTTAYATRSLAALKDAYPALQPPVRFAWCLAFILLIILLYVFPDGRFVPRWTRALAAAAIVIIALSPGLPGDLLNLPGTSEGISTLRGRATVLALMGLWGTGIVAQVFRYRHVSGTIERQQVKWILFSLSLLMVVIAMGLVVPSLFLHLPDAWFAIVLLATAPLGIAIAVSTAVAVLRYRLYDIDRIISRTVAYATLSLLLGMVYAVLVLALGQLFGGIGAKPPTWGIAAATLVVAALFQPVRRRVQGAVDRRFNRRHFDAVRTVEAFTRSLRTEVDLGSLSDELLRVVGQTMQPATMSLWLRSSEETHDHLTSHRRY